METKTDKDAMRKHTMTSTRMIMLMVTMLIMMPTMMLIMAPVMFVTMTIKGLG